MKIVPKAIEDLSIELSKLPGVGPRTAERLTFHLLKSDPSRANGLSYALADLHSRVTSCKRCHTFAEGELCEVCLSPDRHQTVIAVVEEPFDVVAIEKTGLYQGLYHVLGGVVSPMDGVGPEQLQIDSLLRRIDEQGITEVILATNPSLEGESTAMYIRQRLESTSIKLTRLARGLPVGGDLEYADQITLGRALQERQTF
jgi:recombination protein RecR